jgi:hypothetical protein
VLPAVDRLDEITGIGRDTAQEIIAEIGLDMSRFPDGSVTPEPTCRNDRAARFKGRRPSQRPRPSSDDLLRVGMVANGWASRAAGGDSGGGAGVVVLRARNACA